MPRKVDAICREPGCDALVQNKERRCSRHLDTQWRRYTPTVERTSGRTLQRQRRMLFKKHPLCVKCDAEGRTTAAEIRDHIIPLTEGGLDVESNTQALCKACHDLKSQEEAKRGRDRVRMPQEYQPTSVRAFNNSTAHDTTAHEQQSTKSNTSTPREKDYGMA